MTMGMSIGIYSRLQLFVSVYGVLYNYFVLYFTNVLYINVFTTAKGLSVDMSTSNVISPILHTDNINATGVRNIRIGSRLLSSN